MNVVRRSACLLGAALLSWSAPVVVGGELVGPASAAAPSETSSPADTVLPCTGDPSQAVPLELTVEGQPATGLYAVPASTPRGLVVFFHGYTKTAGAWSAHLARVAAQDGVIAVAMNYRGLKPADEVEGVARSTGMPIEAGAEDGVAVAEAFDAACPGLPRIVAYGNSLGGAVAGVAVAEGKRRTAGGPLFDRLITTAGASNLVEGWAELNAGAVTGRSFFVQGLADLEAETGGTPVTVPQAYRDRSSVFRATDIASSGVTAVTLIHGLDDGLVPVNQSVELALALTAAGVPVDLELAGGRPAGDTEAGDTLDALALSLLGYSGWDSPLVGHPHDEDPTHALAVAGFKVLAEVFAGAPAPTCLRVEFIDPEPDAALGADPVCSSANLVNQLVDPTPVVTVLEQALVPVVTLLTGGLLVH